MSMILRGITVVAFAALAGLGIWQDLSLHHEVSVLRSEVRAARAQGDAGVTVAQLQPLFTTVDSKLATMNNQIDTMASSIGGLLGTQSLTTANLQCLDGAVANPSALGTACG